MRLLPSRKSIAGVVALACAAPASAQCEIAKLVPSSTASWAGPVDLHGTLAVLGDPLDERAYLFDVSTGLELFPLQASDTADNQYFGASVATDGALVVVGSDYAGFGAAYLFDAATGTELFKLVSPSPTFEAAGSSVDVQGDLVVVGAPSHDWLGSASGAVHLFSATTGQHLMRLVAYDGGPGDLFGRSVALDGDWIVAGAPRHDDHFGTDSGAAYAFHAATGTLVHELLPENARPHARFGESVAVHGDLAVVATEGTDEAFLFDLITGAQVHRWSSEADGFGTSVAIEGATVLVGAPFDATNAQAGGAAFVFDAGSGELVDMLFPSDAQVGQRFSQYGIALSGGRALVPAIYYDDGDPSFAGYLYALTRPDGETYCTPSTPNSSGLLGHTTAEGCDAVLANDLTLVASSLPPHQPGYFLASQTQGFVPNVGGSQGDLCLAGNLARFAKDAASSGPEGEIRLAVDLTAIPTSPPTSVMVGETWSFQCWYRDVNPTPTSNLTSGLAVTFR